MDNIFLIFMNYIFSNLSWSKNFPEKTFISCLIILPTLDAYNNTSTLVIKIQVLRVQTVRKMLRLSCRLAR